jgi:uncharacterized protein
MIARQLVANVVDRIGTGKAIVVIGPRQVGKTTLIHDVMKQNDYLFLDGDDPSVRNLLDNASTQKLRDLIGTKPFVFIDECQRIRNIGLTSKIIVDQIKSTQLILSGSSSFEINEEIKEPLTGRKWTFDLLPISYKEWEDNIGTIPAMQSLPNRLVYGFYPDVLNNPVDEKVILAELVDSYLFKDILLYSNIKKSDTIVKLTQALAYQVGNEVNYSELANLIGIDAKTVVNYIDVLEKGFVVFRLNSFNKNQRNEIKKGVKIYFYDNGVRNAVIKNYNDVANRNDVGQLWENFLISERLKQNKYAKRNLDMYFWRTTQQQEIDYIEIENERVAAFEFKWSSKKKALFSKTFTSTYHSVNTLVNQDNFRDFTKPYGK